MIRTVRILTGLKLECLEWQTTDTTVAGQDTEVCSLVVDSRVGDICVSTQQCTITIHMLFSFNSEGKRIKNRNNKWPRKMYGYGMY